MCSFFKGKIRPKIPCVDAIAKAPFLGSKLNIQAYNQYLLFGDRQINNLFGSSNRRMNSRPPSAPASLAVKNDAVASMSTPACADTATQLNAASMGWMKSPNACHLVAQCIAEFDWDDGLAQRVLVEYVRFCHLKVLHGDERTQQIVPPDLVQNMWQVHYADFVRYEMDMWTCFGVGTFLWFNISMLAEHCTVAERIEQTKAAVLAICGTGGYDDNVWSENSQLLQSINESKAALKNVANTNADPVLCACCAGPLRRTKPKSADVVHMCCGKEVCGSCIDAGVCYNEPMDKCLLCGVFGISGIGVLKKNAKKGLPWAQFFFAEVYKEGDQVTQSHYDAMRWYRKADSKGHPAAALAIGEMLVEGNGCKKDVPKALEFAKRAIALDPFNFGFGDEHLIRVSYALFFAKKIEAAASVLLPLVVVRGSDLARYHLACMNYRLSRFDISLSLARPLALEGCMHAIHLTVLCCRDMGLLVQERLWRQFLSHLKFDTEYWGHRSKDVAMNEAASKSTGLVELRGECSTCGIALCATNRKLCKRCKTFCYCSRKCQKIHWNQPCHGHRSECKGVTALREAMASKTMVLYRFGEEE